ncbi:AraC family transcriptional regulator [Paludibacterium purpuratum]|uniref:Helix-turn-helix protein n=1 Tax=Paludibacterium purpuratum TaxID=1144873 RepID=A0A4R7B230_9NEIS|nr:helix-turn-helix domain-containing protein [Paludibacterium purpuratum]TDR73808.1 helix-turn-helix protein [Paludibacterium purpuratum]
MTRRLIPPHPALGSVVRHYYLQEDCGGIMHLPATPFPSIGFILTGQSHTLVDTLPPIASPPCFVTGPFDRPVTLQLAPGSRFATIMLRLGQLPVLFGLPTQLLANQAWPLHELIGQRTENELFERLQATATAGIAEALDRWLTQHLAARSAHNTPTLLLPPSRLYDDSRELARHYGLGVRQLQRKILSSYGMTLRDTRRMARYINMLALLIARPDATGRLASLAQDCGYFDQAHMTKDFRALTGHTPGDLARRIHGAYTLETSAVQYSPIEQRLVLHNGNEDIRLSVGQH